MSAHPYDEQPHDPTRTPEAARRAAQYIATGRAPIVFGVDRLPERERDCPAWRPLASTRFYGAIPVDWTAEDAPTFEADDDEPTADEANDQLDPADTA